MATCSPVMVGVGVVCAVAMGMAASDLAEDVLDDGMQRLYSWPAQDTTLEAYFEAGQDLGGRD